MRPAAQLSVRFKAFNHDCLLRAQKQIQTALTLCQPLERAQTPTLTGEHEESLQQPSEQTKTEINSFGLLDPNPKVKK